MKHQLQIGTESGIVSREAVKQIRMLITDLARTVQILDVDMVAEQMRPHGDQAFREMLDTRRHNLLVTIASLEIVSNPSKRCVLVGMAYRHIRLFRAAAPHRIAQRALRFWPKVWFSPRSGLAQALV
jgi:hypothetical protein